MKYNYIIEILSFLIIFSACSQNKNSTNYSKSIDEFQEEDTTVSLLKGEKDNNEVFKELPSCLKEFVPDGYSLLDTAYGNLNLDNFVDLIIVLRKNDEKTTSDVVDHPEKRPLLILIGQKHKKFKLAAKNDNVVYCIDCGGVMGDPFMKVVIKKGYFSVEHYGGSAWRWTRIVTFKYSPKINNWFLFKDGGDSYHVEEPEKKVTKILSTKDFGVVPFEKFDIYTE